YNVVISDIAMTKAQRQSVDFTVPVYTDRQVLVSCDSAVTSPLGLAGKKVWAPSGSPAVERLENLEREIGDTILIEDSHSYTSEQLCLLVAKGEIERAVVNEAVARHMAQDYPDLCISTGISLNQFQAWAVAKNNPRLLERLNNEIESFKTTAAYKALCEKWLDKE
ncbi:MAG: transporter substrate-binding domain-containing protein, partial [Duncaniella sp.]|nr:transporter substrate-binding domain-containing protein [Duncaniella sp.]